jgi:hypothetical protein
MKVLLVISDYECGFPFIQDLEAELLNASLQVDVLDITHHWHKRNGFKINFAPKLFNRLKKVRKVGTFCTLFSVKWYLRNLKGQYDAVSIHSCEHIYYYLIKDIKAITPNLSVMIWGSDFYRISNEMREQHRRIFDTVKYIVFGNPQNAHDFTTYYRDYAGKSLIAGFGVKKFELIKQTLLDVSIGEARKQFGVPTDKIAICCGYNGREMQQHLLLIDEINLLKTETKKDIFVVFQIGYGADKSYIQKLMDKMAQVNVSYTFIDRRLTDLEVAMFRLVPDITLNAQVSDGFSSSIQEHLLAQNILIVGDWLPYNFLHKRGVFFKSCKAGDFHVQIETAILHLSEYKQRTLINTALIDNISGWQVRLREWLQVFQEDTKQVKFQFS